MKGLFFLHYLWENPSCGPSASGEAGVGAGHRSLTDRWQVVHRGSRGKYPLQACRSFLSGTWTFVVTACPAPWEASQTCRVDFTTNIFSLIGPLRSEWPEGGLQFHSSSHTAASHSPRGPKAATQASDHWWFLDASPEEKTHYAIHLRHLKVRLESVGVSLPLPILSLWKAPWEHCRSEKQVPT